MRAAQTPTTGVSPERTVARALKTASDSSSAPSSSRGLYTALKRAEQAATEFELPAVKPPSRSEARALVIVAGITILVGAALDNQPGRIIMVGAAGVGLYGLYHYIK